ncbi:MAG: SCO family protein [Proteobacteria bacterium]|nr:SCO family protein [Pseudomonadota bacterium]
MSVRAWLVLILAAMLTACGPSGPRFNSTDITGADYGKDFSLKDANGKTRTLADFKGMAVVVFFGYTRCPDVCPTTMVEMKEVLQKLGHDAQRVQVLFVTIDPERDTPELLAQYVPAFDPSFIGLYGDLETTTRTAKDFKVFFQKVKGKTPDNYTMDHTAGSYVFDPQGRLRLFVRHGGDTAPLVADLKTLLAGS